MTTVFYIAAWYLVCALIIGAFFAFYNFTNMPRFRDEAGDVTTEAGYSEDTTGKPLHLTCDDECPDSEIPHVEVPGTSDMGAI